MFNSNLTPKKIGEILKKISIESPLTEEAAFCIILYKSPLTGDIDCIVEEIIDMANKGLDPMQIIAAQLRVKNNLLENELIGSIKGQQNGKGSGSDKVNAVWETKIQDDEHAIFSTDQPNTQSILEKELAIKNEADKIRNLASSDFGFDLKHISNNEIFYIVQTFLKISNQNWVQSAIKQTNECTSITAMYEFGPPHSGNSRGFSHPA